MEYTDKQKKEITKTIGLVSQDIIKLFRQVPIDRFRMKFKQHSYKDGNYSYRIKRLFQDDASWEIVYDKTRGVGLTVTSSDLYFVEDFLLGKNFNKKQEMDQTKWTICLDFIMNYSEIRKDLIAKIEEKAREINAYNSLIDGNIKEAKTKLHNLKNAVIEFNFPPSVAEKEIEIEKKDGKTIGTINFGERSISIITDGDIVLVPRTEEDKTKVKQK